MADHYVSLRERLIQTAPDLAIDLDQQWKIANTEWLPAMKMSDDSANGLPHIRNIENHLDTTLNALYQYNKMAGIFQMRPIETYLLLAATLFHDIGRINEKSNKDHGNETFEYLKNCYSSLGIRNREVAYSLGRICASHSLKNIKDRRDYEQKNLNTIVIDPYGEVRQRMIAAFLTLGDNMDNSHTRVIPPYLRKYDDIAIKGSFRNIVLGIYTDPAARLVKTILMPESMLEQRDEDASKNKASDASLKNKPIYLLDTTDKGKTERDYWLGKMYLQKNVKDQFEKALSNLNLLQKNKKPDALSQIEIGQNTDVILKKCHMPGWNSAEKLLAWNILRLNSNPNILIPWRILRAMVLGDLRKNRDILYSIRDQLAAVGLSLATWLVDCEERLYTPDWCETYEPLFHKGYLNIVTEAMWDLSRRIISSGEFSYAELSSFIGDNDVVKARMAVRRISIITSRMTTNKDADLCYFPWASPIWAGDDRWKWRVKACGLSRGNNEGCVFFTFDEVINHVNEFSEPYDISEFTEAHNG